MCATSPSVAVRAESGQEHKAYSLTGPEALTYNELAGELSKALGRSIRHISLSPADLKAGMLAEGTPEEIADRLIDLEHFYRDDGASRITNDIKQVTGRDPGRFAHYTTHATAQRYSSVHSGRGRLV